MEEEKQRAEEEAECLQLEAATTLIEFSQQEFVRDMGTQTNLLLTNHQQIQNILHLQITQNNKQLQLVLYTCTNSSQQRVGENNIYTFQHLSCKHDSS